MTIKKWTTLCIDQCPFGRLSRGYNWRSNPDWRGTGRWQLGHRLSPDWDHVGEVRRCSRQKEVCAWGRRGMREKEWAAQRSCNRRQRGGLWSEGGSLNEYGLRGTLSVNRPLALNFFGSELFKSILAIFGCAATLLKNVLTLQSTKTGNESLSVLELVLGPRWQDILDSGQRTFRTNLTKSYSTKPGTKNASHDHMACQKRHKTI
jgi:hypothetical protein